MQVGKEGGEVEDGLLGEGWIEQSAQEPHPQRLDLQQLLVQRVGETLLEGEEVFNLSRAERVISGEGR